MACNKISGCRPPSVDSESRTASSGAKMDCYPRAFARRMATARAGHKHRRLEAKLMSVFQAFINEITRKPKEDETAFMRHIIRETVQRMKTPEIEEVDLEAENREKCILNLQKVIRGKVVQTMMCDEIDQNLDTILQLKALHKTDPFGLNVTYAQASAACNLHQDRELQQEMQNEVTEIVDQLEGETLSRMFDFLEKEMVRLLDEKHIHGLIVRAEKERRMKEASEGGRRQKEEEERRINDEIYRQIVGIHQATVDMYLEDLYLEVLRMTRPS